MPLEIRQLVIRAVAQENNCEAQQKVNAEGAAAVDAEARTAIVDAAVREVLRILKASKER